MSDNSSQLTSPHKLTDALGFDGSYKYEPGRSVNQSQKALLLIHWSTKVHKQMLIMPYIQAFLKAILNTLTC